jgi:hypothetical protein
MVITKEDLQSEQGWQTPVRNESDSGWTPAMAAQSAGLNPSALYRAETQRAKADPSRLSGLQPALKAQLQDSTKRFETSLQRNGAAVEALKALTEGLVKALADEANRQAQAKAGYGPGSGRHARVGAIACNQTA